MRFGSKSATEIQKGFSGNSLPPGHMREVWEIISGLVRLVVEFRDAPSAVILAYRVIISLIWDLKE